MNIVPAHSSDPRTFIYLSNAIDGTISSYRLSSMGSLIPVETITVADFLMPMVVSSDKKHLYAAARSKPYTVFTFAIDENTGALRLFGKALLADSMPYISLDRTNNFLFSSSYGGDIITVNAVTPNGQAGEILQILTTARHPHAICIDKSNRYVYVPSLGTDRILQFVFNEKSGRISLNIPHEVPLDEVAGPRHLVISADNRFVYILSEFLAKVYVFSLNENTGLLSKIGDTAGLPKGSKLTPGKARSPKSSGKTASTSNNIAAADIHLTPDGEFLYISERTGSTISSFRVNKGTGKLTFLQSTPTVKQPRGFAIDPEGRFLIVSGETSDHIAVYEIGSSGKLKEAGLFSSAQGFNWVEIVTFDR
jgi:6-phosphogluconolactonase